MKRTIGLFLIVICLLSLASCKNSDAPYTDIPENTQELNMGGSLYCGVVLGNDRSFEEYAQNSELAVECEYIGPSEYMRLERKEGQKNFTYNKFRVISVLRGEWSESDITVRTDGGTVYFKNGEYDGISDEYNWSPEFKENGRYILFLNKGSRRDWFCTDSEYYNIAYELFCFDENSSKYLSRMSKDTLPLTADARSELAQNYCFTSEELKALLDDIAAPLPPTDEQERINYIIALNKQKLDGGEITAEEYEYEVSNLKIYDYSRIVVRHKVGA